MHACVCAHARHVFFFHHIVIVQDSVLLGTLTVRENIAFSAALRMPSMYKNHRSRMVDCIVKELGLATVANKKVNACTDDNGHSILMMPSQIHRFV